MKTVFNTRQCAHVWAQQTQVSGRNAGNSAHFSGPTFYSYATPIAAIVETKRGKAVLITSIGYSSTTRGKHIPAVSRAVSQYQTFRVPYVGCGGRSPGDVDHVKNKAHLVAQYHDAVKSLMRCPADSWRLDRANETLTRVAGYAYVYAKWAGLAAPRLDVHADVAQILARRERLRTTPEYRARMTVYAVLAGVTKKYKAEKYAKRVVEYTVRVQEWRAGASVTLPSGVQIDGAMLRIVGDTVQTSLGAEVPLADARRAYAFWRITRDWHANGDKLPVGPFHVDSIDTDGNVRAGCHLITRAELENFGKLLEQVK